MKTCKVGTVIILALAFAAFPSGVLYAKKRAPQSAGNAPSANPKDPGGHSARGFEAAKKRDYETAIAEFTKAIEAEPKDAKNYFNRGTAYRGVNKMNEAIADYTKAIEIDRTPGTAGADPSAVFKGLASSFQDTGLTNKVKYVYTINAFDEAGNKASESVSIVPGAKLYSPARGSVATSPPLLAWRPVTGASYYNLQVYYGVAKALRRVASLSVSGRKVMSAWPLQPRYRMRKTWTYKGKVRKLALGRYRWYVYPGVGKRTAHKYGPLIGQSDFVIAKR